MPPKHFWTDLSREPNFDLLSTADDEAGKPMPEGLSTLGRQSREAYEDLVGSSKVLLGMGHPPISPSVYTALSVCLCLTLARYQLILQMSRHAGRSALSSSGAEFVERRI